MTAQINECSIEHLLEMLNVDLLFIQKRVKTIKIEGVNMIINGTMYDYLRVTEESIKHSIELKNEIDKKYYSL